MIKLIADNGGGMTLQVMDDFCRLYQHTYDDIYQCIEDALKAEADCNTVADWDNNEEPYWIEPTSDEISNGGYRILDFDDLRSIDPDRCSWGNIRDAIIALEKIEYPKHRKA